MRELTGHYVEVDGIKTYYESCGETGPAVLMLHTAGRDCRQWHGVMEQMGARYRTIALDLPGHGKSWPLPQIHCLQDIGEIVKWILRFATAIGVDRFVTMGCSLGGNVALLLSARSPRVVAALALEGVDWSPVLSEASLDLMTHPQVSLMHSNMDYSMSLVGSGATPEGRAFSEWGVLSLIPLAQQGCLRAYSRCDFRDETANIQSPVLLLRGTEDWAVSADQVHATAGRLTKAARLVVADLPGIGHFPHLEAPELVARHALDFLDDLNLETA